MELIKAWREPIYKKSRIKKTYMVPTMDTLMNNVLQ